MWWEDVFTDPELRDPEAQKKYIQYQSAYLQHSQGRDFFTTKAGYMGICPASTAVGDQVCLLSGSQVPYILRQNDQRYQLVGECYVHGIMDGEIVRMHRDDGLTSTAFCLK